MSNGLVVVLVYKKMNPSVQKTPFNPSLESSSCFVPSRYQINFPLRGSSPAQDQPQPNQFKNIRVDVGFVG